MTPRALPATLLPAILLACLAAAPRAAADAPVDLHVTRVAVFSSGVAYFECDATVEGDATAELSFRTAQINDILKSLLVQDLGGGTIRAVGYASQDPVEKALRSFGVDITGKPSLARLLDQLRGEPVEISGERSVRGVVLSVERQKVAVEQTAFDVDVVNVLTDAGIVQLRVDQLGGIRFTNEKIDGELRKALATLAASHDADKKSVVLSFAGRGQRRVRVAYLLEAPIWKTSYRLALSEKDKPYLQGWATVENATEEDWKDVSLSLVSGRPISFIMDLYSPLYVPRPVEQFELYASLRPPQYEGSLLKEGVEEPPADAAPAEVRGLRARSDLSAEKKAPASPALRAGRAMGGAAGLPEVGQRGLFGVDLESVAEAAEAGELFEYAIRTPVSIPRRHSAMLPIVGQAVEGEKVSIYNASTHSKHPLNGLHLKNTSGLHLMQGPVTVFDGEVYAGDAKLPDLKPDEKRLLAYALDLGVEVAVQQKPAHDELLSVRIAKGTLWHRHKLIDARTYVVKNKLDRARTVLLEQPYGEEWKLIEPKEPFERTAQLSRFKVVVPGGKTAEQKVELEYVTEQSLALSNLGGEQIAFYLRSDRVSPGAKQALERVVALRSDLDAAARERARREQQLRETEADQVRVRENLKTLERNTDSYQRQLRKFDELEGQIEAGRKQLAEARQAEENKRAALESFLLSVEVE